MSSHSITSGLNPAQNISPDGTTCYVLDLSFWIRRIAPVRSTLLLPPLDFARTTSPRRDQAHSHLNARTIT